METSWLRTLEWWITTMFMIKCWRRTATSMIWRTMATTAMGITVTWSAELVDCLASGDQLTCSYPPFQWLEMAMAIPTMVPTLIKMAITAPMAMTTEELETMAITAMMAEYLVELERPNRVCLSQVFVCIVWILFVIFTFFFVLFILCEYISVQFYFPNWILSELANVMKYLGMEMATPEVKKQQIFKILGLGLFWNIAPPSKDRKKWMSLQCCLQQYLLWGGENGRGVRRWRERPHWVWGVPRPDGQEGCCIQVHSFFLILPLSEDKDLSVRSSSH